MRDELTGKIACLQLNINGISYFYSSKETCELDYSVLSVIGPLLATLKAESEAVGSQHERQIHKQRARKITADIAKLTFDLASQRIIAKDYERANPAALRCLRMLTALHGSGSVNLVPAQMVLAEANLGLNRLPQVEEFLALSSYVLSTNAGASNSMRSRLHRNYGKLHVARGNLNEAAESFSKDIVHCSVATGPESIEASPGYYNLGRVFAAQSKADASLACFDKVVEIWYMHMTWTKSSISRAVAALAAGPGGQSSAAGAVSSSAAASATARTADNGVASASEEKKGEGKDAESSPSTDDYDAIDVGHASQPGQLTAVEAAEGLDMLSEIAQTREARLGPSHVAVAEVRYTAALVLDATGEGAKALPVLINALEIFTKELVGCLRSTFAVLVSSCCCCHPPSPAPIHISHSPINTATHPCSSYTFASGLQGSDHPTALGAAALYAKLLQQQQVAQQQ